MSPRGRGPALFVTLVVVMTATTSCNRYGYSGHIEVIDAPAGSRWMNIRGWVDDRLASGRSGCPDVTVTVNGRVAATSPSCRDGTLVEDRPDVTRAEGGVGFSFTALTGGFSRAPLLVCLFAGSPGASFRDGDALDCVVFDLPADEVESSFVDSATWGEGVLTAEGWYYPVISTLSDLMKHPAWIVDGVAVDPSAPGVTVTEVDRPDVTAARGAPGRGLRLVTPLADPIVVGSVPEVHVVCIALVGPFGQRASDGTCRSLSG